MAVMICALVLALSIVRSSDLDKIGEYELLHLDVDTDGVNPMLKFRAFSVDYTIELQPNNDLIPSTIHHTNGNPTIKSGGDPYFTSQTKTCHYFGRLIAPDTTAIISVSMCTKHGIRGEMRVNGETLILRPSALYLEDDPRREHSLTDEYIVYKLPALNHLFDDQPMVRDVVHALDTSKKRRLAANGGKNLVEVLILIHPSFHKSYEDIHGTNWYEEATTDITTAVNTVSTIFKDTDWTFGGRDLIGEITFRIVEFEVVDYTNPFYIGLLPYFYSSTELEGNCDDPSNPECGIDASGWLYVMQDWIKQRGGLFEQFDNVMMMHRLNLCTLNSETNQIECGWGGYGTISNMCYERGSVSHSRLRGHSDWYRMVWSHTMIHEAGHNFHLNHDQNFNTDDSNPRCNTESGLMGYGDVEDSFSECSKKDLNAQFESNDMSCLATRTIDLITNYGPNAANGRPTSAPTPSPVQPACFDITDCDNDVYNTRYTFTGDYNNKRYMYSAETIYGTRYLYKYSTSW
eukprot:477063_1